MQNIPKWCWTILAVMLIIVVCVLLKFNVSVGSNGIHATQDLVK
jgi:hypothetical protein